MPRHLMACLSLLVLSSLLLLCGCFDVEEDFHVNNTLSGTYSVKLSIPKMVALLADKVPGTQAGGDPARNFQELKAKLEAQPFIKSATMSDAEEGELHTYTLLIDAKDMRKLGDYLTEQSQSSDPHNPYHYGFSIKRHGINQWTFERKLEFQMPGGLDQLDPLGQGRGKEPEFKLPPGAGGAAPPPAGEAPPVGEPPPATDAAPAGADPVTQALDIGKGALKKGHEILNEGGKLLDQGSKLLDKGKGLLGGLGGGLGRKLMGNMLADHYYTVRFYGPEATEPTEWKTPLSALADPSTEEGKVLRAEFSAFPEINYAVGLVIGILVVIVMTLLKKRKKSDSAAA